MIIGGILVKHEFKPGIHIIIIGVRKLRIGKYSGLGRTVTSIFEKNNLVKVDTHVENFTSFFIRDRFEMNRFCLNQYVGIIEYVF
jgi:hypothetical protein